MPLQCGWLLQNVRSIQLAIVSLRTSWVWETATLTTFCWPQVESCFTLTSATSWAGIPNPSLHQWSWARRWCVYSRCQLLDQCLHSSSAHLLLFCLLFTLLINQLALHVYVHTVMYNVYIYIYIYIYNIYIYIYKHHKHSFSTLLLLCTPFLHLASLFSLSPLLPLSLVFSLLPSSPPLHALLPVLLGAGGGNGRNRKFRVPVISQVLLHHIPSSEKVRRGWGRGCGWEGVVKWVRELVWMSGWRSGMDEWGGSGHGWVREEVCMECVRVCGWVIVQMRL